MLTIWEIKEYDSSYYEDLKSKLDLSPALVKLLVQRGIYTYSNVQKFLYGTLKDLSSPYKLSSMKKAVDRVKVALNNKEKVVIYGDYDVDGVCSIVILLDCFKKLGLEVDFYVPDRFDEGYGLNLEAIKDLASQDYSLVITVDCGITAIAEVELAKSFGMDFIITDHHTPADKLPPAVAIVNPKLDDDDDDGYDLAGAGVAFKLAWALSVDTLSQEQIFSWLDLVALATVADVVPMVGDNRILVRYGLRQIEKTTRPGLKALLAVSGLADKEISTWHIGFILAPRLNAAGRMESARLSIELLLSNNYQEALIIANELNDLNNYRRSVEDQILKEAILHVETNVNLDEETILVIGGDNWHPGVIGIVASRLVDKYNRPTIIISWEGDEGRGSGRSVIDFDLYSALKACDEYLIQFGGHKLAAGLSIEKPQLANLKEALLSYSSSLSLDAVYYKKQLIDLELETEEINSKFTEELKLLEPFGEGNNNPNFVWRGVEIANYSLVGKDKNHFKCKTLPGNIDAIAFGKAEYADEPFDILKYDLAFNMEENEFLGRKSLQLKVRNLKSTITPDKFNVKANDLIRAQAILNTILNELDQGHPIVLVYPTYRTLNKHYITLKEMFNPNLINRLHGKCSVNDRKRLEVKLKEGNSGIFLVTKAYLDYYLKLNKLPNNLEHLITIWPILQDNLTISDKIKMSNLFEQSNVKINKEDIDINQLKHAVVYANRPATVAKIANHTENVITIAGITDYQERKRLRSEFLGLEQGILILDGACDFYGSDILDIEKIYCADVPFSHYEGMLIINQINATEDIELVTLFGKSDVENNRQYLIRNYPDIDIIENVLLYFKNLKTKHIQGEINDLNAKIASNIKIDLDKFSLLPILWILLDLDLCQVNIKDNIMAIKFFKDVNLDIDIIKSPYYLEGVAEKAAFIEWENILNNN
ncbi:MAG TPA: single-stranded-DNA-specific exonuclease RecJ [Syntrophomonadaceae bacterium]|nr:single-stranded-DNA-specific exonuclease RecJ [Syntrophomonadaceae bacterium]